MRHATESTLEDLTPLLERLRSLGCLVEKRPGVFYRGSKAFLHFHEDPTGIFVDVRFSVDEPFIRLPVNTVRQRSALVAKVKRAVRTKATAPTEGT